MRGTKLGRRGALVIMLLSACGGGGGDGGDDDTDGGGGGPDADVGGPSLRSGTCADLPARVEGGAGSDLPAGPLFRTCVELVNDGSSCTFDANRLCTFSRRGIRFAWDDSGGQLSFTEGNCGGPCGPGGPPESQQAFTPLTTDQGTITNHGGWTTVDSIPSNTDFTVTAMSPDGVTVVTLKGRFGTGYQDGYIAQVQ